MEQGHSLAQYAADFFLHSTKQARQDSRAIPLGLDEAIFLQPVNIGDHVTFTARVVHSTKYTCRVVVIVEVRSPSKRHERPLRSNRLSFVFGANGFPSPLTPDTYTEILMHFDAERRSNVEGPFEEEVEDLLRQYEIL